MRNNRFESAIFRRFRLTNLSNSYARRRLLVRMELGCLMIGCQTSRPGRFFGNVAAAVLSGKANLKGSLG